VVIDMPEPSEADTAARAAAIESELQTSIDEAKADVANEARSEEERRASAERLESLEARLRAVESQPAPGAMPAVEPPAAAPDPNAEWRSNIERRLDEIAGAVAKPVEPIKGAAEDIGAAVTGAADDAAEVVESVPVRTHGMFKKVFGGGRD